MDKKKEWIAAVNYGKYLAFVLATVFVIVSRFATSTSWLKIALIAYVSAFGLTFTSFVIHASEIYNAGRQVKKEQAEVARPDQFDGGVVVVDQGEMKGQKAEVVSLKTEQVWTVVGAVASGMFAIFTFVVLILL